MLCQLCNQRDATVHFTRIINNQKIEMFVCEQCAKENEQLKLTLNKLLSGIMGVDLKTGQLNSQEGLRTCPECGMAITEFNKTGKMGCSTCYENFSDSLEILLKRIHGNVRHHGKMPKKISTQYNTRKEIGLLKESLKECIENEEYEEAAEIRDKIRELERKTVEK